MKDWNGPFANWKGFRSVVEQEQIIPWLLSENNPMTTEWKDRHYKYVVNKEVNEIRLEQFNHIHIETHLDLAIFSLSQSIITRSIFL
mgnify:CR=1 FL=1